MAPSARGGGAAGSGRGDKRAGAGSRGGKPDARGGKPGARGGKPDARDSERGARGGKPGVRGANPGARDERPEARDEKVDPRNKRAAAGRKPTGQRPRGPVGEPGADGKGGTVKALDEGPMRIHRALARAGAASRREADRAVAEGRVTINGVAAVIGQTVDARADVVQLDGRTVSLVVEAHRWIVLHKPAAIMTTRKDPAGRKTVFDLVEDVPGLVYVGRLDFMTEGVLLLTTDGRSAHALTHPSNEIERTYVATVRGDAPTAVREARRGVRLEDGMVVPRDVSASALGERRWAFEVTIAEGRTHEVRRLCEALDLEVERLVRTQFGPVRLGALKVGATRALTVGEREMLEAIVPRS